MSSLPSSPDEDPSPKPGGWIQRPEEDAGAKAVRASAAVRDRSREICPPCPLAKRPSPPDPPRPIPSPAPREDPAGPEGSEKSPKDSAAHNRAPLRRKPGDGIKVFTRLVTRSEAPAAAPVREWDESLGARESFGKLKGLEEPGYAPNRAHEILNDAWIHSRVRWIDQLGTARTVLLSALFLSFLGILVWHTAHEVIRRRGAPEAVTAETQPVAPDGVRQENIRQAFEKFLAARTPEQKSQWVLEPGRVEPRMKDYYLVRGEKDPRVVSFGVSLPTRAGNEWWFTLTCLHPDRSSTMVLMKETPGGGRVDWENFVAYGTMPWPEFVSAQPAAPHSFRARLKASNQYAEGYNALDHVAFDIVHRDGGPALQGYAFRSSRVGQHLMSLPSADWQSVNLYLQWNKGNPETSQPRQVEILELIRNNWLDSVTVSQKATAAVPPRSAGNSNLEP